MKKIETSSWKDFKIYEIFYTEKIGEKIQVPTGAMIPKKNLKAGNIPRITVSNFNNGITGYYKKFDDKNYRLFENFISVSFLGTVFYQECKVSLDMKVHCLKPINYKLNKYTASFLVSVIRKAIANFEFSDQLSSTVLPLLAIKLPKTQSGEPNWEYMESYMKDIMRESEKKLENLQDVNSNNNKVESAKWKDFIFGKIFQMQKQKEISPVYAYNKNMQQEIKYPFYGQSSENNGIISYISLEDRTLLNNKENNPIIMIHSNNHLSFYVNSPFYLKDGHGATSLFTNKNLNEYNVFFIISVLNKTMADKFDYSLKATKEKLNSLKIKLPVDGEGEPDWEYMENYMKNIMQESEWNIQKLQKLDCCK